MMLCMFYVFGMNSDICFSVNSFSVSDLASLLYLLSFYLPIAIALSL